jgi:parallel beta-helix repeat protein
MSTSLLSVNDAYASTEVGSEFWTWGGISFLGASLSGMTDLGISFVNGSSSPCATLWNNGTVSASELFFNNINLQMGDNRAFWFQNTNEFLLLGSTLSSGDAQNQAADQTGPVYLANNSNSTIGSSTFNYYFGRMHMQNNTNLLLQGNTIIRDAENNDMDNGTAIESGGVELSFGQNVHVLSNTIETLNAPPSEVADGESIMTQNSNVPDILDAGSVTAITSTTLTDTSALWGSVTAAGIAQYPEVVAIYTGSGTGEWRTIQSVNTSTKTLTLSQPWNTIPEVGSLYSIFPWTFMNATIQGNTLINNPNGIVLYDGCYNCTVQNNTLTNSRGIQLRIIDEAINQSLYPEGRRVHEVAIGDNILNNTVSDTSGIRPSYIALDTEAFDPNNYNGMGMINIQVGGNILNPYSPNPNLAYNVEISQEGIFPCFLFGPAPNQAPVTTVFQNVNFWNNSQSVPVKYTPSFVPFATQACATPSAPTN